MRPVDSVLAALADRGLLLEQDKVLPSVVGIVTGESLRGSWWSHPKGRLIFSVLSELADHPDVLVVKFLARKATLVHRPLWPAVLAVGAAREPWQMERLSPEARRLLGRLDRAEGPVRATGKAVKELEVRLLAVSRETHTESGRHEMALESWQAWSTRAGCRAARSVARARKALEEAATAAGASVASLPWPVRAAR